MSRIFHELLLGQIGQEQNKAHEKLFDFYNACERELVNGHFFDLERILRLPKYDIIRLGDFRNGIDNLFRTISLIRRKALNRDSCLPKPLDMREYYFFLFVCSLASLKFKNLLNDTSNGPPKCVPMFLSACAANVALEFLNQFGENEENS